MSGRTSSSCSMSATVDGCEHVLPVTNLQRLVEVGRAPLRLRQEVLARHRAHRLCHRRVHLQTYS